ncbi:acyl-CoA dehydrogenase [Streptomyces sp. SID8379]|uniref:acyl-CoA dehydrogenase family protein n=1 Tax=unclassified Streptomyces TaxID=2593676 RepID=UPI000372DD36|nr:MULTISPECIES: acyl-CoA dehydrogenase family protein [unclassified Streptomyces]MYW69855.1 acyl-CoA dehydrogenase [Streptomyces sp. SID8379]
MNSDLHLLETTASDIFAGYQDRPGLWEEIEDSGLTLVGVPEEAGGSGGDSTEAVIILRAAAYHCAEIPLAETQWLAAPLLAAAGLPVPAGPLTAAEATPDEVRLTADGDGWILDGTLPQVPWARQAHRIVVVTDGRACSVDPAHCTFETHHNLAGEPRDDVTFSSVRLTAADVAALPEGPSLRVRAALARTVQMAGAARRALDHSLRYAGERRQFGRPIAAFQAVQQYLAEMAGEVALMDLGAQVAAAALADPDQDGVAAVAAARVNACRAAGVVAELAHQVHGAIGTTHEHDLRRATLRLWSWREEYGNEHAWSAALGLLATAADDDPWLLVTAPTA